MTNAAGLYGKSLYDLARSEDTADDIMEGIRSVEAVFREQEDYLRLLSEPSIPKKERLSLLTAALRESVPEYLLNFLLLLVEKGLILRYRDSFRSFTALYNADRGISVATVCSAVALTEAQRTALIQALKKRTGKEIELRERIDAGVLGGLRVEVDGKTLDGTVESRLGALRKQLSSIKI